MRENGNGNPKRLSNEDNPVQASLKQHRQRYLEEYEHVHVLGDPRLPLPRTAYLQRTFRDLRQIRASELARGNPREDLARGEPGRPTERDPRPVRDAQLMAQLRRPRQRMLIIGDGGNGKTEFTRHVAYLLARDMFEHGPTPIVPLRVELKNLQVSRDPDRSQSESKSHPLLEALREESDALETLVDGVVLFDQLADAGQLVLIFDGLDELDSRTFPRFEGGLIHAVRQGVLRNCSIMLTGRSNAISNAIAALADAAFHYVPQPLQAREMERFITA